MKKLNYWILMLLACVSVGFLSACSEDDDEPGSGSSNLKTLILGTWYDEAGNKNILSEDGTFEVSDAGVSLVRGTYTIYGNGAVFMNKNGEQYAFSIVELTKDELCVEWEDGAMQRLYRDA